MKLGMELEQCNKCHSSSSSSDSSSSAGCVGSFEFRDLESSLCAWQKVQCLSLAFSLQ